MKYGITGFAVFALAGNVLVGCSSLPDVTITDRIANGAKPLAQDSVQVVKPEHAKRFDDPAWPAPIQVVPPAKDGALVDGEFDISVFGTSGSDRRVETIYVTDGEEGSCKAAFEILGYPDSDLAAVVTVGSGGGATIRCGNIVIASDTTDLTFRHPFISNHYYVELVSDEGRAKRALSEMARLYPITVRYTRSAPVDAP